MKISVVVVVKNKLQNIKRCLASLRSQTFQDFETIFCIDEHVLADVAQSVRDYCQSRQAKIVSSRGLSEYEMRVQGLKSAEGDWITFLSDTDYVANDRYRQMMQKAGANEVNIVWGPVVVYEAQDKRFYRNILSAPSYFTDNMNNAQLLQTMFQSAGLDEGWYQPFAGLYSHDLVERMLPTLKRYNPKFDVCTDLVFSVVAALYTNGIGFVESDPYYLMSTRDAPLSSSEDGRNVEMEIRAAFDFLFTILTETENQRYERCLAKWRTGCVRRLTKGGGEPAINECLEPFLDNIATIKKQIAQGEAVSFDIFDTLVIRPFWYPTDIFVLLGEAFAKRFSMPLNFDLIEMRRMAEALAREKVGAARHFEVTIREIYEQFATLTGWATDRVRWLEEKEISLEIQFCKARRSIKDIYDYAVAVGKKVVVVSDMYFPRTVLHRILVHAGYDIAESSIYVSCENNASKVDGSLYGLVCNRLHMHASKIIHIGDNFQSDFLNAQGQGWQSVHFPKPTDLMLQGTYAGYRSWLLQHVFGVLGPIDGREAMSVIGIRSMMALVANRLYDNPFRLNFDKGYFGSNPFYFGFFALGMHLLAFTQWLHKIVGELHLTGLHFLARDGYLLRKAYDLYYTGEQRTLSTDDWYINRKIAMQMQLMTQDDFSILLAQSSSFTPTIANILSLFKGVVEDSEIDRAMEYLTKSNAPTKRLEQKDLATTVEWCRENLYIPHQAEFRGYINKLKNFFMMRLAGPNDATVDVGYSCRPESALKRLGVSVTPIYIHTNGYYGPIRDSVNKLGTRNFYDFKQTNTGIIRELMFSSFEPSCGWYDGEGDAFGPVMDIKDDAAECNANIVNVIQTAALEFVQAWRDTFHDAWDSLSYNRTYASLPYDFLLTYSGPDDHKVLTSAAFNDAFGTDGVSPVEWWNNQTSANLRCAHALLASSDPGFVKLHFFSSFLQCSHDAPAKMPVYMLPWGLVLAYKKLLHKSMPSHTVFTKRFRYLKYLFPYGFIRYCTRKQFGEL